MNILLAGAESPAIQTLKRIAQSGHHLAGVLAAPPQDANDPRPTLWNTARQMGLETWPARRVKEPALAEEIRRLQVDLLLNVHSLYLIHPDVIAAPRIGCYNLHPGPLPRYAGLNTVSWAIYRGETTYGVTVHRMEAGIDTGDIAYQTMFPVSATDSALAVYSRCIREGVAMLARLVEDAARGADAIPRIAQDLSLREYFSKKAPDEGRVVWTRTAGDVFNHVRACDYFPFASPWGQPLTQLADGRGEFGLVRVERTGRAATADPGTVGEVKADAAEVACADEWLLVRKVMAGGTIRPAGELLRAGDRCV